MSVLIWIYLYYYDLQLSSKLLACTLRINKNKFLDLLSIPLAKRYTNSKKNVASHLNTIKTSRFLIHLSHHFICLYNWWVYFCLQNMSLLKKISLHLLYLLIWDNSLQHIRKEKNDCSKWANKHTTNLQQHFGRVVKSDNKNVKFSPELRKEKTSNDRAQTILPLNSNSPQR